MRHRPQAGGALRWAGAFALVLLLVASAEGHVQAVQAAPWAADAGSASVGGAMPHGRGACGGRTWRSTDGGPGARRIEHACEREDVRLHLLAKLRDQTAGLQRGADAQQALLAAGLRGAWRQLLASQRSYRSMPAGTAEARLAREQAARALEQQAVALDRLERDSAERRARIRQDLARRLDAMRASQARIGRVREVSRWRVAGRQVLHLETVLQLECGQRLLQRPLPSPPPAIATDLRGGGALVQAAEALGARCERERGAGWGRE